MEKKAKPNRKPFFRFIKKIVRIFKRKPKVIFTGEKPTKTSIYISNHSAASGPSTYELFFPYNLRMWGTYEMCGNFRMRWRYLNKIYFPRKKKRNKFASFLLATVLTPLMALFYKGMRIIPSYPDFRLSHTVETSIEELENGVNILIFPEDSSDGYHEILTEYYGGFWYLAKKYVEKTGNDIDIVNMYYHKKSNTVAVGEARSFSELSKRFPDRKNITEFFLDDTNRLFTDVIQVRTVSETVTAVAEDAAV